MRTCVSGWPRIGTARSLKFATEDWLAGRIDEHELQTRGAELRLAAWKTMAKAGIDDIPSLDFSFYDGMLDAAVRFGAIPARYRKAGASRLETTFAMARGSQSLAPLPMKKWFITNYHYIVPELADDTVLTPCEEPFAEYREARSAGIETVPTLIGPWTFLRLSRFAGKRDIADFADEAANAWALILREALRVGVRAIRFEEPALTLDVLQGETELFTRMWRRILSEKGTLRLGVGFPFGDIRDAYGDVMSLPFDSVALDFVDGRKTLELVRERGFPADRELVAGIVNGRNVRANDLEDSARLLDDISSLTGAALAVGTSCSLLHVPLSLAPETELPTTLKASLAFAEEKLGELKRLACRETRPDIPTRRETRPLDAKEAASPYSDGPAVAAIPSEVVTTTVPFRVPGRKERRLLQSARFRLPPFPVTTIGSFPQTAAVRSLRARLRTGEISSAEYDREIFSLVKECVRFQEKLGIDVLVHGEFERNDMVEFFAERLEGFAFTRHGWVQSYGTRCVKPAIVAGDIRRAHPITVDLAQRTQRLTDKPVKGMLTGPATILAWSFPREDIPVAESAFQISRALREEVLDLERHGIAIIQIDEAALREKMPPRASERGEYLQWAVSAFRFVHSGVRPETQIHTHMCYSDFTDIVKEIDAMDADVITFEAARSDGEILPALVAGGFETATGPGVWDIHSPRVPPVEELTERIIAMARLPGADPDWVAHLWVNPDCGLKTRGQDETEASLVNLVAAARRARETLSGEIRASTPKREAHS